MPMFLCVGITTEQVFVCQAVQFFIDDVFLHLTLILPGRRS